MSDAKLVSLQSEKTISIAKFYEDAENSIKKVENLTGQLAIPAVNQLRYAGYHIVQSLLLEREDDIANELRKAENHCKRAIYDSYEIGILYFLNGVKIFHERNVKNLSVVCVVIKDYQNCKVQFDNARESINEVKNESKNGRDAFYKEIQPHYDILHQVYKKFNEAEPIIQNIVVQNRKKQIIQLIGSAIVGAVITAIFNTFNV